jgi:hypothetical protein
MTKLTYTISSIVRQGSNLTVFANAASPVPTGDTSAEEGQHIRDGQMSFVVGNVIDPSPYVVGGTFTTDYAEPVSAPPADPGATPTPAEPEPAAVTASDATAAPGEASDSAGTETDPNYPHGGSTPVI